MSEEIRHRGEDGGVAESVGDTDIDLLVGARNQTEAPLYRFPSDFAVLFVDLVGTPSFFERYGETALLVLLQQHNDLVVPVVFETGGVIVKSVGDTALVLYTEAREAARTAFHILDRVGKYNAEHDENERFQVRVGLTFAKGSAEDQKVFDTAVEQSAQVVKTCRTSQILASAGFRKALKGEEGIAAERVEGAPEDLYLLTWTGEGATPPMTREATPVGSPPDEGGDQKASGPVGEAGSGAGGTLGRYEIVEEIGVGGMGVVYKAHDPTVGRSVAIKTVRLDSAGAERDELVRRLRQEALAVGRLEHPAIVTVYDAGEDKGVFYLAMQFVEGKVLSSYLSERTLLPVNQILAVMEDVCDGLHYAHERGIVHRDLKPANIILTPAGRPKVLDFGIAKLIDTGNTAAGTILGTPNYMSPEQTVGRRIDRRSDIFSLGAILYELLTSERAFSGDSATAVLHKIREEEPIPIRKLDPTIPPALEDVVRRALEKDPFRRYQTAEEMKTDLTAVRTDRTAGARASGPALGAATVMMSPAPSAPSGSSVLSQPIAPTAGERPAPRATPRTPTPIPSAGIRPSMGAGRQPGERRTAGLFLVMLLLLLGVAGYGAAGVQEGWLRPGELPWVFTAGSDPLEALRRIPGIGELFRPLSAGVQQAGAAGVPAVNPSDTEDQQAANQTGGGAQAGDTGTPSSSDAATQQSAQPAAEIPPPPERISDDSSATRPAATRGQQGGQGRGQDQRREERQQVREELSKLPPEESARVRRWLRQAEQFINRNELPQAGIALKRIFEVDPENEAAKKLQERLRRIREAREL